jgi:hypothetical protein
MIRPVLIVIILFITACNHKPGTVKISLVHGYFYYPKPNVYYDTTEKSFIYFDSTIANWKKGSLPASLASDLGKSVLVTNPSNPVWNNNKEDRLMYSATLYADSGDFKKHSSKETTEAIPKQNNNAGEDNSSSGEEAGKKKEHHKVGDFLRRIFGRKKHNE